MLQDNRIFVAGHHGLVGSALMRNLQAQGYSNLITRTLTELDLRDQSAVGKFFEKEKPEYVFLAAAKVGGIHANNTYPAEFIHQNILIQDNIIHQSWKNNVKRLLFLGSSCIYPRDCPQPMKEEYLLTGPLESTNSAYAIAKISGIEMCRAYNQQYDTKFLSVMPTNLYGPGDSYDLENSHVLPALIRKMHEAKMRGDDSMTAWGTGSPFREFLYSDDMASACIFLMAQSDIDFDNMKTKKSWPLINIGSGSDLTIRNLAEMAREIIGFKGNINWDSSKPDGTPKKLLEVSFLQECGWHPSVGLEEGISKAYEDYCDRYA